MNIVCKGMASDCSVQDKTGHPSSEEVKIMLSGTEMKTSLRLCLYTWTDTSNAQTFP